MSLCTETMIASPYCVLLSTKTWKWKWGYRFDT